MSLENELDAELQDTGQRAANLAEAGAAGPYSRPLSPAGMRQDMPSAQSLRPAM